MSAAEETIATRRSAWGLGLGQPEGWMGDALCAQIGGDLFYVDKGESTQPAKALCAMCPVRHECLKYALDRDERFGIWGGLSERERRRLKRAVA